MRTRRLSVTVRLFLVIAILAVAVVSVAATSGPGVAGSQGVKVAKYVDPRFGFTLEYPADWEVDPRNDTPGRVGGSLTLKDPIAATTSCGRAAYRKVEIGVLLVERDPSMHLMEWAERYEKAYFISKNSLLKREEVTVNGQPALFTQAQVPEGDVSYVYVPYGRLVWYVWTNSLSEVGDDAYGQMLRSFRFGRAAPKTLLEAYGSQFMPMPLDGWNKVPPDEGEKALLTSMTDYIVPVDVFVGIACGNINAPVCITGTHTGALRYAIDIGVDEDDVYTPIWSWFYSAGWDAGKGNYVMVLDSDNGWVSHNYHLESIDWDSLDPYLDPWSQMPRHRRIGTSGETGYVDGAHLHFHVQTTGTSAVQLAGMYGLTLYGSYPNCSAEDQDDCDAGFNCTCGYVN